MQDDREDWGKEPDPRPREERELDSLNEQLARAVWSTAPNDHGFSDAACRVAGVDPDRTVGSRRGGWGWAFLPGGLASFGYDSYPKDPNEVDRLSDDILDQLTVYTAMLEKHGPDRPDAIIRFAVDRGAMIPWLPHWKHDPERVRAPEAAAATQSSSRMTESQRAKARKKAAQDPRTLAISKVGPPIFEAWRRIPPHKRSSKSQLANRILDKLTEDSPDLEPPTHRTVVRHIDRWLKAPETPADDR